MCKWCNALYSVVILNQKFPVVKMRPLVSRLPRGGGGGGGVVPWWPPAPPTDLKSACIKEIACPISIFCK